HAQFLHVVGNLLAHCTQRLDALVRYAPDIEDIRSMLGDALVQVEEAGIQLNQKLNTLELDPQRLQWVEQRIQIMLDLARKHRCDASALAGRLQELKTELSEIGHSDAHLAELETQISETGEEYRNVAVEVSACRNIAAKTLSKAVTDNMQELGMAGGRFKVHVESSRDVFTRYGFDRVEYQVSANKGQPLRALGKVASGGELSRISLALQVVIAAVSRIPTLVFDEVDVGIGGGVAEVVGRKLRLLGQSRQVLCITHLPQVASQGMSHFLIGKKGKDEVLVEVQPLDGPAREDEIARMLGGIKISDKTRAHAKDMLTQASGRNAK
ncbi:DNA repair protein RecN, partial [Pseudomonadota bacterium]